MENETSGRARLYKIGACLLIATFAQTSLKQAISPKLGYIDWLLLVTIYVSMMREPVLALMTGTVAGILHDFASGVPVTGVSGIGYIVAAYIGFWVSTSFLVEGLLIRVATVAGASVVAAILRLSLYTFTVDVAMPVQAALELILGPTVNLLLSLVMFPALDQFFDFGRRAKMRRAEALRNAPKRRKWLVKNKEPRWKIKRRSKFRMR
ncbi:MAG TPA: rod shape-determining protein MreD [Blastocatellia bacterium]|nr:rod shape-determining protein MreD [Blastocatellia bacterium]